MLKTILVETPTAEAIFLIDKVGNSEISSFTGFMAFIRFSLLIIFFDDFVTAPVFSKDFMSLMIK